MSSDRFSVIPHPFKGLAPFVIKFKDRRYSGDLDMTQDLMGIFMDLFFFGQLFPGGCIEVLQKFAESDDMD